MGLEPLTWEMRCTPLYPQSYKYLGTGQLETQFCTPTEWVRTNIWFREMSWTAEFVHTCDTSWRCASARKFPFLWDLMQFWEHWLFLKGSSVFSNMQTFSVAVNNYYHAMFYAISFFTSGLHLLFDIACRPFSMCFIQKKKRNREEWDWAADRWSPWTAAMKLLVTGIIIIILIDFFF